MNFKRVLGCCILIMIFTLSTVVPSLAGTKSQINKNWRGLAIKGYDPVAFFKEGTPVEGSNKFEFIHGLFLNCPVRFLVIHSQADQEIQRRNLNR